MINIEELKENLKPLEKEYLLQTVCSKYGIEVTNDIRLMFVDDIKKLIIAKAKELNNLEALGEVPIIEDEPVVDLKEYVGKKYIRKQDTGLNNPDKFECVGYKKDGTLTFKFPQGKIDIPVDLLEEQFYPYVPKSKTKEKQKDDKLTITIPGTEKEVIDENKVIKIEVGKNKKESKPKKPKQENKEPKKTGEGGGRGRLYAKILCFDSPERKNPIHQFNSFVEAKEFLQVKNVGDSLEKASASGKSSRGYWWIVQNIHYESNKKEDKLIQEVVCKETPTQEEIKEQPKIQETEKKQEQEIILPINGKFKPKQKDKIKDDGQQEFELMENLFN